MNKSFNNSRTALAWILCLSFILGNSGVVGAAVSLLDLATQSSQEVLSSHDAHSHEAHRQGEIHQHAAHNSGHSTGHSASHDSHHAGSRAAGHIMCSGKSEAACKAVCAVHCVSSVVLSSYQNEVTVSSVFVMITLAPIAKLQSATPSRLFKPPRFIS